MPWSDAEFWSSGSPLLDEVEHANTVSVTRMMESEPIWVDVGTAKAKIPKMGNLILHSGPPLDRGRVSGPMKGAIIGATIFEGWAETPKQAEVLFRDGEIKLDCNHHHNSVAPMAGVISPSMPVFELRDKKNGSKTYSNMNEGIGRVLRHGAYGTDVIKRLKWMAKTLGPVLKATIDEVRTESEGIQMKPLIAQALTMGDDCHNRYNATSSLLLRQIGPYFVRTDFDQETLSETSRFMGDNNFTALNLGMAAAKSMTLASHGIKKSTIVSVMSRNGTETGIWVSGLGEKWFTAKAPVPAGLYFPGFKASDANRDIGDSAITETAGFGAFAMAGAPAIVSWVGGSVQSAIDVTNRMYTITQTQHKYFQIPFLDFRGTPTGIDVRKVIRTGIVPFINTGIAHKTAGKGQIGAGTVSIPIEVFNQSLVAFANKYGQ
jgi:hypothetical protein